MRALRNSTTRPARFGWTGRVAAILGSVLGLGLLMLLLLPSLVSVAGSEVVEDPRSFTIGTIAEIEPDAGWSVQPISGGGQLLKSPDRALEVSLRVVASEVNLEGEVRVETLANNAQLSHKTVGRETTAVLRFSGGGEPILVEAKVLEPANPADYRAELAELLLHVKRLVA